MTRKISIAIPIVVICLLFTHIVLAKGPQANLPNGLIMLWAKSFEEIPTGWQLCDGTNDTPDLRGRFVVGAPFPYYTPGDPLGDYGPGDTGGNTYHTHSGGDHNHDYRLPDHQHFTYDQYPDNTGAGGEHTHPQINRAYDDFALSLTYTVDAIKPEHTCECYPHNRRAPSFVHTHDIDEAGEHTHALNHTHNTDSVDHGILSTFNASATGEDADHIPPFISLAFICKIDHSHGHGGGNAE